MTGTVKGYLLRLSEEWKLQKEVELTLCVNGGSKVELLAYSLNVYFRVSRNKFDL